jgi:hypothetical protein
MDNNSTLLESLFERATEYGQTTLELTKLQALDKTSDVVSSFVPRYVAVLLIATFILFLSLGSALWLGEILGKVYLGFFVVAAIFATIWIVVHFFLHKWLKSLVRNYFIKKALD